MPIKKKYFDMILSGYKKEEYRELKSYWLNKLGFTEDGKFKTVPTHLYLMNGYSAKSRAIKIECKGLRIGKPRVEWSDETFESSLHLVFELGEIVETANL
jgi:hypothetical protein